MQKFIAFLKAHWLAGFVIVGGFLLWRSLSARIDAASSNSTANSATAGYSQLPVFTANAGGYDNSASGVTAGISSGNSDAASQGMVDALMEQIKGANAAQLEAIKSSSASNAQALTLNSQTTNSVANAFSSLFPSWLSNKDNQYQQLNVSLTPNASGGINLSAKTDFNPASAPTQYQAGKYVPGSALASTNPFKSTATTFDNFDSAKLLAMRPDLANSIKNSSAKQQGWWWGADQKNYSVAQSAYAWWQNVGQAAGVPFTAKG